MSRKTKKNAKISASSGAAHPATHAPVILDVAGIELTADDRRRLAHPLTGGAILFSRNWVDRRQLTGLVAEMKAIRPDLLVCVDHEGGRVQRFRTDGFTHLPAMRAFGELWLPPTRPPRPVSCWRPNCAPAAST